MSATSNKQQAEHIKPKHIVIDISDIIVLLMLGDPEKSQDYKGNGVLYKIISNVI